MVFRFFIKTFLLLFLFLGLYFFYKKFLKDPEGPSVIVNHNTVLQEITAIGKLELVQYHFKDIVEYQKEQTSYTYLNKFIPKAKAVLIISGEAIGCIDLTKITQKDVLQGNDTIIIFLPKPELCHYKIDHQKSKVYDVTSGYLFEQGPMVSEAFKEAELKMKQSALEMGILGETRKNAQKILVPILRKVTGKVILVKDRVE